MPVQFDGTNTSYGTHPDIAFPTASPMSFGAWVKSFNNTGLLYGQADGTFTNAFLVWGPNGYTIRRGNAAFNYAVSGSPVNTKWGRWQWLSGTVSPSGATIDWWEDGVIRGSNGAAIMATIFDSNRTMYLGINEALTAPHKGQIAHMTFWDSFVGHDEQHAIARGKMLPCDMHPNNVIAYWPLIHDTLESKSPGSGQLWTLNGNAVLVPTDTDAPFPDENKPAPFGVIVPAIPYFKRPGLISRGVAVGKTRRRFNQCARSFSGVGYLGSAIIDISGQRITMFARINGGQWSGGPRNIGAKWGSGDNQYRLFIDATGTPWFYTGNGAGGGTDAAGGTTVLALQRWYSVCGTRDGALQQVFLNGKLDGVNAAASLTMSNGGQGFYIGTDAPNNTFIGWISDMALWDVPLTGYEIQELDRGVSPSEIRPGNLRGYWPLDDYGASGQARDRSKYNNNFNQSGTVSLASIGLQHDVEEGSAYANVEKLLAVVPIPHMGRIHVA